jgi:hypothetical protein
MPSHQLIGYLLASAVFFFLINRVVGFRSWLATSGVSRDDRLLLCGFR